MTEGSDIRTFLKRIGLEKLVDTFVAEDIDWTVLLALKEEDLREIGLTIGQRRKIVVALDEHRAAAGVQIPATVEEDAPELRRLSVLFCDMVGSTQLANTLAPDEMHDVLQTYYGAVSKSARQFGGYVASLQGDGVVVLFGYPAVKDADAARAIGAGLALQTMLARDHHVLPDGRSFPIRIRIGIATGQALISRPDQALVREGLHMVGPVVNRAARLQSHTRPGTLAVDEQTRSLAQDVYDFERLPAAALKGFDADVDVSVVRGERLANESAVSNNVEPRAIFGREQELKILKDAWAQAQSGRPAFALLTGEAGIGKSAIVQSFESDAYGDGARVLHFNCMPLSNNNALFPVKSFFENRIGRARDSAPAARLDALRYYLQDTAEDDLWPVARMLELPTPPLAADHQPAAERVRLLNFLVRWLSGIDDRPTLVLLEDTHWIDATTRDLMSQCEHFAGESRVMFMATSRKTDEPVFTDGDHLRHVALSPIEGAAAEQMIQAHLGERSLPAEIHASLLQRCAGNPLMIEALTLSSEHWTDADLVKDFSVPNSIYETFSAPLDRLTLGKKVAGMLSIFDEPPDVQALAMAMKMSPEELNAPLDELRELGILEPVQATGGFLIRFRHQRYRDVLHERLVSANRRKMHADVARTLGILDPTIPEQHPERLALHYSMAGDPAAAAPMALRAGERSLERSALVEAGYFLEQCLSALDDARVVSDTGALRLRVLSALASVKRARLGIASEEVGQLGRQILELARVQGDTRAELLALSGLYSHALVGADYRMAEHWGEALLSAAAAANEPTYEMIGLRAVGVVALHRGEIQKAIRDLSAALEQYDVEQHKSLAYAHGYDHAEICSVFLSFALWLGGDLQAARKMSDYSVSHSRQIDHAHSLGQALAFRSMLGALARDTQDLAAAGAEASKLAHQYDFKVFIGTGDFFGFACEMMGRAGATDASDFARLHELKDKFFAVNPFNYRSLTNTVIALLHVLAEDFDTARAIVDEAFAIQEKNGETWLNPEVMRLQSKIYLSEGKKAQAIGLLVEAYQQAVDMGANTIALRVSVDLYQIDPTSEAKDRVDAARARMMSLDEGWDVQRLRALEQSNAAV